MNYLETKNKFSEYVQSCKNLILKTFFDKKDCESLNIQDSDINEFIKSYRLEMIKRKVNHTMRMIIEIEKINKKLNLRFNFREVLKVAILLHDLGRFRQATWSNTFSDSAYHRSNSPFKNHGEDGYDIFLNNDFMVDKKYIPVIGMSILHHLDSSRIKKLNAKYDGNISSYNIDQVLTGNFQLNEGEWQAASIIVGFVADIDRLDILHQFLLGEEEIVRDYIYEESVKSIDAVAKKWGVSKKEILEYNHILEKDYNNEGLKVPIKNMDLNKLVISDEYREMFFSGNWLPLSELRGREDWNFVALWWWRLSAFLNEMVFYEPLDLIKEMDLINKIYEKIPENLKFLFTEAFTYANEVLVNDRLANKTSGLYL